MKYNGLGLNFCARRVYFKSCTVDDSSVPDFKISLIAEDCVFRTVDFQCWEATVLFENSNFYDSTLSVSAGIVTIAGNSSYDSARSYWTIMIYSSTITLSGDVSFTK